MNGSIHRLLLVRHAQGSLGTDDYDRLSPTGHAQAGRLGDHLREIDGARRIVRGGLRRHRETAESIADRHDVDEQLDEYRVDHLFQAAYDPASGLGLEPPPAEAVADPARYLELFLDVFPDVLAAWQSARLNCPVNGSWAAFDERVRRAGDRLIDELDASETVTAVTSAGVISTLTAALLAEDLAWQRRLNVALYNASVTELHRRPDGRWHVERINCVEHLQPGEHTLA
jgi:broad specificity phosphatase PhoE